MGEGVKLLIAGYGGAVLGGGRSRWIFVNQRQPGLRSELQVSQRYIVRPCTKRKQINKHSSGHFKRHSNEGNGTGEAIIPGDGVDVVTQKNLKMLKMLCCPMIATVLSVSPYK